MSNELKLPTISEELKSFNFGIVIFGFYYGLEFGSLQGLYPIVNSLKIPTLTSMAALGYSLWLILKGEVKFDKVNVAYFVFIIYLIFNALFMTLSSDLRENSVKLLITYLAYFVIASSIIKNVNAFILLVDLMLAFMAYTCLHGMLQGGLLWGSQWLSDENIYAVFCCTGIPFAYILMIKYTSWVKKLCYAVCLTLFVIGVVLAASRGGFLSFFVIVLIVWISSKRKFKSAIFIIFIALISLNFIPQNVLEEFENINVDEQENQSGERTYLWRLAGDMFLDNKIFGIGVGNYGDYFVEYDNKAEGRDEFGGVNWRGIKMVAHSTPASFLAETGLVGIITLITLLLILFRKYKFIYSHSGNKIYMYFAIASFSSMLSYWAGSLFLTLTIYPFFYNLVFLSIALLRVTQHDNIYKQPSK